MNLTTGIIIWFFAFILADAKEATQAKVSVNNVLGIEVYSEKMGLSRKIINLGFLKQGVCVIDIRTIKQ